MILGIIFPPSILLLVDFKGEDQSCTADSDEGKDKDDDAGKVQKTLVDQHIIKCLSEW